MTRVGFKSMIERCELHETVTLYRATAVVLTGNNSSGYDFSVL
jgi:hypothetical protein